MFSISISCPLRESDHSICESRNQDAISRIRFQKISFVVHPNDNRGGPYPPGCDASNQVAMRVVNIQDIKPLSTKIVGKS